MHNGQRYLRERDLAILEFAARYRAITSDMVQARFFSSASSLTNTRRVLRRLEQRGLLRKVVYDRPRSYFAPTARGNRTIGYPDFQPRLLTEQSLPASMAIAWYCVHANVERMTSSEFQATFPALWSPELKSSNYYVKDTGQRRKLGLLLVDRGGTPRRIKGKIRRIIRQRESIPVFAGLIRERRIVVTVLTGLKSQEEALFKNLKRRSFRRIQIECFVVQELGELLTSR